MRVLTISYTFSVSVNSLMESDTMVPKRVKVESVKLWSDEKEVLAETFQSVDESISVLENKPRPIIEKKDLSTKLSQAHDVELDTSSEMLCPLETSDSINPAEFRDSQTAAVNVERMESAGDAGLHVRVWNDDYEGALSEQSSGSEDCPVSDDAELGLAVPIDEASSDEAEDLLDGSSFLLPKSTEKIANQRMQKESESKANMSMTMATYRVNEQQINLPDIETYDTRRRKDLPKLLKIIKQEPIETDEECVTDLEKCMQDSSLSPEEHNKAENAAKTELPDILVKIGTDCIMNSKLPVSPVCRPRRKRTEHCLFCMVKVSDSGALYDHIKKYHSKKKGADDILNRLSQEKLIPCDDCGRHLKSYRVLQQHRKQMHCNIGSTQCPHCDKTLKSHYYLRNHIWRLHSNPTRRFLCHLCPASFKVQGYLSEHLKHVHTSNIYKCNQCNQTFTSDKYLRNHKLRVHKGQQHQCPDCERSFSVGANLRRHIQLVHTKSNEHHECSECKKTFSLKSNLKEHVNSVHLKKFTFVCKHCNEGFRRKKELTTHLKMHEQFAGMAISFKISDEKMYKVNHKKNVKTSTTMQAIVPKAGGNSEAASSTMPTPVQQNTINFAMLSRQDLTRMMPGNAAEMVQIDHHVDLQSDVGPSVEIVEVNELE